MPHISPTRSRRTGTRQPADDNLAYLATNADDAALQRAADAVGLRPLAERLGGYDARLGAGDLTLSAGERQLIALRADRILILDGQCARIGTHEDLMAASPAYRELLGYWTASATAWSAPAAQDRAAAARSGARADR